MPHFSSEQITRCLMGEFTLEQGAHARECRACRAELERLETALTQFRSSVRQLSAARSAASGTYQVRFALGRGNQALAGIGSLLIHGSLIAGLLVLGSLKPVQTMVMTQFIPLFAPNLHNPAVSQGGGGGGAKQPLDASKGKLPKSSPRQFTPPRVDTVEAHLPMTPTILADDLPQLEATNYGDPLSKLGMASNGIGWGGGIGTGDRGGIGPGHGTGFGPGTNGGFSGAVYKPGGGVSAPIAIYQPEPEYSEEARKARWQGVVSLALVVDENGKPSQIRVTKALGLGLDQKAIEAVQKWRFKPGTKDGRPVPVIATVEVSFRLL